MWRFWEQRPNDRPTSKLGHLQVAATFRAKLPSQFGGAARECGIFTGCPDSPCERAAETIFPLIASEPDDGLRVQLAAAMSAQLDDFAIEPASRVYRENPNDPERKAIIENLYALACVADIDLPDKEAWGRIIESESLEIRDLDAFRAAAINQQSNRQKSKKTKLKTPSIQRPHIENSSAPKKLGRNAPCSWGSGKKYKKCSK